MGIPPLEESQVSGGYVTDGVEGILRGMMIREKPFIFFFFPGFYVRGKAMRQRSLESHCSGRVMERRRKKSDKTKHEEQRKQQVTNFR